MSDYLFVQAVNLRHARGDTQDLSTRRAGGYMLLEAIQRIANDEDTGPMLESITRGASEGLFRLKRGFDIQAVRAAVAHKLQAPPVRHATFLMADSSGLNLGGDLPAIREALLADVRRQQMTTLSFCLHFEPEAMPSLPAGASEVCDFDGLRPASAYLADEGRAISRAVLERRQHGRGLRQRFYATELAQWSDAAGEYAREHRFTDDLQQLTRFHEAERPCVRPLVEGKMALLYVDGNSFGRVRAQCRTIDDMRRWDHAVQQARREFLLALLTMLKEDSPDAQAPLRLETLMWGGDEFLLVLPAWQGLKAADLFFRTCVIRSPDNSLQSHSAALVIAHHHAPIGPLEQLAHQLADSGKAGAWRQQDVLNWIVLESFDHAGGDLERFWVNRGLPSLNWDAMAINPTTLSAVLQQAPAFAQHLPRRSLYRIVDGLRCWATSGPNAQRLVHRAYSNLHEAMQQAHCLQSWRAAWLALLRGHGQEQHWPERAPDQFAHPSHLGVWLTISELIDYVPAAFALEQAA